MEPVLLFVRWCAQTLKEEAARGVRQRRVVVVVGNSDSSHHPSGVVLASLSVCFESHGFHPEASFAKATDIEGCSSGRHRPRRSDRPSRPLRGAEGRGRRAFETGSDERKGRDPRPFGCAVARRSVAAQMARRRPTSCFPAPREPARRRAAPPPGQVVAGRGSARSSPSATRTAAAPPPAPLAGRGAA